jgi:condensin complex subunit 1
MGMLDVLGNLIHNCLSTNQSETAYSQILSFYNVIEERFRDNKSYVRAKVLQVLYRLGEYRDVGVTDIPIERFRHIVALTVGRLHDKASNVRKNAIKLLARFCEASPFTVIADDKGKLNSVHFERKRGELKGLLKVCFFLSHLLLVVLTLTSIN